jgi:hypothetical protein
MTNQDTSFLSTGSSPGSPPRNLIVDAQLELINGLYLFLKGDFNV